MFNQRLDRRRFLGGAMAAGTLAALPRPALALLRTGGEWAQVQAVLDRYVGAGTLPGVAAAIGRGTDPALFMAAGTIARDSRTAVDADSLWRVYSMTKPITGMAAMMLVEDGKIALDQNIAEFIPAFANPRVLVDPMKDLTSRPAARPITVRNLLTHTAGLGYSIITKGPLLAEYIRLGILPGAVSRKKLPAVPDAPTAPSLEIFADRLATLPLIADPGAEWSYSVSLDLMGRVIELASGMAFDAFLQQRIFDPLGMTSTWFQVPADQAHRLTTNYFMLPIGPYPVDPGQDSVYLDKPPFPFGGAGLVSSARDYDRFLAMLAGEGALNGVRVMKTETARLAMSNLMPEGAKAGGLIDGAGFGAGGRVTLRPGDMGQGTGTFGWGGAAATIAWVDRERGIRGAGYAQYMPDTAHPFTTDIAKAVYSSL